MIHRFMWLLAALCLGHQAVAAPKVTVTIAPVHSLVQGVMKGVGEPTLIFPAAISPHGAGLKPSQIRQISSADLVVGIGSGFSPAVERAVGQSGERVLWLTDSDGMLLLPARDVVSVSGEHHEAHDDDHDEDGDHDEADNAESGDTPHHHHSADGHTDPHIWLSAANATTIVSTVSERLSQLDPVNRTIYQSNAAAMRQRIGQTRVTVSRAVEGDTGKWLLFHDAFQYFENEYDLQPAAIATSDPDKALSGKRLQSLSALAGSGQIRCIFREPQFNSNTLRMLGEDRNVPSYPLDPLGRDLPLDQDLWFRLMENIGAQFQTCAQHAQ